MKPDSSLISKNQPFIIPSFSDNIHHEVELIVKINRLGKHIDEKFSHKYYEEIGLGIDFTARDLQTDLRAKGHPWEKSKAFDNSCLVGGFLKKSQLNDVNNIDFELKKNNKVVGGGHLRFPRYESTKSLFKNTKFNDLNFLHYYDTDNTPVLKAIDYSFGVVKRTPDHDKRVQNPRRPMSIVVDCRKS